ncbi:hypothetical protein GEMRC1_002957 [Eukaryota sp. GEM-RC1]
MSSDLDHFIETINHRYVALHETYEDAFWQSKMGLNDNPGSVSSSLAALNAFLSSSANLDAVNEALLHDDMSPLQLTTLQNLKNVSSAIRCLILQRRNKDLEIGYVDPETSNFIHSSTVQLANLLRTNPDHHVRKAAFIGLRQANVPLLREFCCIINHRNRLAKMLGYSDFYEYKTQTTERMSKEEVFKILEDIRLKTREPFLDYLNDMKMRNGDSAVEPWNLPFYSSGSVTSEIDPYFSFKNSVRIWLNCFSSLGVTFRGSSLTLDLLDRPDLVTFLKGSFTPPKLILPPCVLPGQVGSGFTALKTLIHEGGHAAAFANCLVASPLFSQERAPFSVINAECQSMFMDSMIEDGDFMAQFAVNEEGDVIPFELLERFYKAKQPEKLLRLRTMLLVPFFERELYQMSEEEVLPDKILDLADRIEKRILLGLNSPRPLISVPHIYSWESSAYYHSYVLAQCAVETTRDHFETKYGENLLHNFNIGVDLANEFWRWGCVKEFGEILNNLTGKHLSSDDLIFSVLQPADDVIKQNKRKYDRSLWRKGWWKKGIPDIGLHLRVCDGKDVICDSDLISIDDCVNVFEKWLNSK